MIVHAQKNIHFLMKKITNVLIAIIQTIIFHQCISKIDDCIYLNNLNTDLTICKDESDLYYDEVVKLFREYIIDKMITIYIDNGEDYIV